MGGVIGALSPKIVLVAGTLLLASRVGTHRTPATIDPSRPITTVGTTLAQEIGLDRASDSRPRFVDIDHSTIRVPRLAIDGTMEPPLAIGADVLREVALLVDLKAMRLQILNGSELGRAIRGREAVSASLAADGCVTVAATSVDGRPIKVAFTGAPASTGRIPILIGAMRLDAASLPEGRCRGSDVAVDWPAFAGKSILLDLGHGRLWIS